MKFVGVELYSGPGGMSLGARKAGIEVMLAVESNKNTSLTYATNHESTTIKNDRVENIRKINVSKKGKCSILFGGPPCQGFSLSNQRTRNSSNPKNWQFKEFIRVASIWKPDWILIENVSGLLKTEDGIFLEMILNALKKAGYESSYKLLNSVNYGVPQKRERLFIVGSLHGVVVQIPSYKSPVISVNEAIGDLPILENGQLDATMQYVFDNYTEYSMSMRGDSKLVLNNGVSKNGETVLNRYKHIPQGGNWINIPDELMSNYKDKTRCHGGIYHRLRHNEPSVVIGNYRKNMLIHPNQDRGLSVREAARLQSFPDSFVFKGTLTDQQQQVGDAVPPRLAEAIFKIITSCS